MPDYYQTMIPNLKVIRSEFNRGYGGGYNFAAEFAGGDKIALVSTDIIVTPGWLDELHRVMSQFDNVLIAGPKYLSLDGRLLEAGSVLFNDGTPWATGRGGDSQSPFLNFVRDADYVSTACVLVDKEFFISTGGFDPRYGAGYFEDTDLCTRAHSIGGRVLYTPFACIFHEESSSFGSEKSALIETNHKLFREKWLDYLRSNYADQSLSPLKATIYRTPTSVLVIDKVLPWHDRASGAKRTMEIIKLLKKIECHVTFVAIDGRGQARYIEELEKIGVEVFVTDGPAMSKPELGAIPWEQLFLHRGYDAVWLTFWDVAAHYLNRLRAISPHAKFIVDTVDLEYVRLASQSVVTGEAFHKERGLAEISIYRAADTVVTVSEQERQMLLQAGISKPIEVIPNIHAVSENRDPDRTYQSTDLLFVGNFNHPPNRDAVLWFTSNIFPAIHKELGVRLLVAGYNMPDEVERILAGVQGVTLLGWISDLAPVYEGVLAAIAPLRYGAGIKGKITEAMSLGVPVIATPKAVEGMEALVDRGPVMIAGDDPKAWIQVINKMMDRSFWNAAAQKALEACDDFYGPKVAAEVLSRILRETPAPSKR